VKNDLIISDGLRANGWELHLRLGSNSGGQVQPEADPPFGGNLRHPLARRPVRRLCGGSRFVTKAGCGLRFGLRFLCCLQEPVLRLALNPDCTPSLLKTQRGAALGLATG